MYARGLQSEFRFDELHCLRSNEWSYNLASIRYDFSSARRKVAINETKQSRIVWHKSAVLIECTRVLNRLKEKLITRSLSICRTSTMIDIITTRFREAYTWIIPPEHEKHQSGSFRREQSITSMRRYNNERRKMFSLDEEVKETHVSNYLCSHSIRHSSMKRLSWLYLLIYRR